MVGPSTCPHKCRPKADTDIYITLDLLYTNVFLERKAGEENILDVGEHNAYYENIWAVLCDKGSRDWWRWSVQCTQICVLHEIS